MDLEQFRVAASSKDQFREAFRRNAIDRKRYVLTSIDGGHLIGVPRAHVYSDATYDVTTATSAYKGIPFDELAYAEELVATQGLRPSDGIPPVPEPCRGPVRRDKEQKFKILDAHGMLVGDLREPTGVFGYALLYFDIDYFKRLNSRYTEISLDQTVLPELQRLIRDLAHDHGFAYREGGDEFIILLRNCPLALATPFAELLRSCVESYPFAVEGERVSITVSIGLAASDQPDRFCELARRANAAKRDAKGRGRNCVVVAEPE